MPAIKCVMYRKTVPLLKGTVRRILDASLLPVHFERFSSCIHLIHLCIELFQNGIQLLFSVHYTRKYRVLFPILTRKKVCKTNIIYLTKILFVLNKFTVTLCIVQRTSSCLALRCPRNVLLVLTEVVVTSLSSIVSILFNFSIDLFH